MTVGLYLQFVFNNIILRVNCSREHSGGNLLFHIGQCRVCHKMTLCNFLTLTSNSDRVKYFVVVMKTFPIAYDKLPETIAGDSKLQFRFGLDMYHARGLN